MSIYRVFVEWMDGEVREFTTGGYAPWRGIQEQEGVLKLSMGNSQHGEPEHLASIPMVNLRAYRVAPR